MDCSILSLFAGFTLLGFYQIGALIALLMTAFMEGKSGTHIAKDGKPYSLWVYTLLYLAMGLISWISVFFYIGEIVKKDME